MPWTISKTSEGTVSHNVLYHQPLHVTRHQERFYANNYLSNYQKCPLLFRCSNGSALCKWKWHCSVKWNPRSDIRSSSSWSINKFLFKPTSRFIITGDWILLQTIGHVFTLNDLSRLHCIWQPAWLARLYETTEVKDKFKNTGDNNILSVCLLLGTVDYYLSF